MKAVAVRMQIHTFTRREPPPPFPLPPVLPWNANKFFHGRGLGSRGRRVTNDGELT